VDSLALVVDVSVNCQFLTFLAQRFKNNGGLTRQQGGIHGKLHRHRAVWLGGGKGDAGSDLLSVLYQHFSGGLIHEFTGDGVFLARNQVLIADHIGDGLRPRCLGDMLSVYSSSGVEDGDLLVFH